MYIYTHLYNHTVCHKHNFYLSILKQFKYEKLLQCIVTDNAIKAVLRVQLRYNTTSCLLVSSLSFWGETQGTPLLWSAPVLPSQSASRTLNIKPSLPWCVPLPSNHQPPSAPPEPTASLVAMAGSSIHAPLSKDCHVPRTVLHAGVRMAPRACFSLLEDRCR